MEFENSLNFTDSTALPITKEKEGKLHTCVLLLCRIKGNICVLSCDNRSPTISPPRPVMAAAGGPHAAGDHLRRDTTC